MIKPAIPTNTMIVFTKTMRAFWKPVVVFQCTKNSIRAGKARPRADKQRAPNSEMNSSKLGIATASRTEECVTSTKIKLCDLFWCNSNNKLRHYSDTNLTCDKYQQRSSHIFPKYFARSIAKMLRQVIGPSYVDRHITGQAVCHKDCERKHCLNALC